ncbi:uncharacterized protein LOC122279473 [Carya illinoinensis]|uniref:uncharacterized protein LOC122279473 n=1 Tax=Carya illinoinensis TaxID=32201 RepID=UPI001C721577|nr:uncharacterized protein LOC122279473 [Carya illinoinensis]
MANTDNSSNTSTDNVESDPRSPYFLTNVDHPGVLLVSEKLRNNNYYSLSRFMFLSLKVWNKLGFIDGFIPVPDKAVALFPSWSKCETIVLSWLLNPLTSKMAQSVIYVDSSCAMWLELKEHFSQGNGPQIFELQTAIATLRQEKNDVSTYFTDSKVLWDELLNYQPLLVCHCHGCTCNSSKMFAQNYHQTYVMTFLMGLNDVFDNVRGQILMMDPLPSINMAFSLVIQEERQRLVSHRNSSFASVESVALVAKSENSFKNFKGNARSRLLCSHCGLAGHIVDKYFKLHGYPPNYKFRDKSKTGFVNSVQ